MNTEEKFFPPHNKLLSNINIQKNYDRKFLILKVFYRKKIEKLFEFQIFTSTDFLGFIYNNVKKNYHLRCEKSK